MAVVIVDGWLAILRYELVHQWTVPIAINICSKALASAPHGIPLQGAQGIPRLEPLHSCHHLQSNCVAFEIHKCVAKVSVRSQVHGHVDEIEQAPVTCDNEMMQELSLGQILRKVAHHECRLEFKVVVG